MTSRIPPASPAAIMLTYSSSKALGCLRIASASEEPLSTSARVIWMISRKALFSSCSPRISRHWTSGSPASSITENWRVKRARRLGLMRIGSLGRKGISRPFCRSDRTAICWRLSVASAALRLSARRIPSWTAPVRVRPLQAKLGIALAPCRGRLGAERRIQCRGSPVDDLLQLVGEGRAVHRGLQRDQALEVEGGERLVVGLHAVLRLAGLHHAVDLVHLVLADQVADRRVGDQDLQRQGAPLAVGPGEERLGEDPLEDER